MKTPNRFRKVFLFLLTLASLTGFAPYAAAAKTPPPEIESFTVTPEQLSPGAALTFTVEGTPRAKASVRIGTIARTIPLKEVSRGIYEGSYTIRRTDKIAANNTIRATLRSRGLSATDSIRIPGYTSVVTAPAVQPVAGITAFNVTPISKIEPGADLKFAMTGAPGGNATFSIDGVAKDIPMREVRSGQYEGSYTIRRLDNFPAAVTITGALDVGGRTLRTALNQSLVTDAKPPVIKNLSPRHGEIVTSGSQLPISATFDDSGGLGVDPKTVRILLSGKDVTQHATISSQFFSLRGDLPAGVYPVEVSARDLAGNSVRQAWKFTVASGAVSSFPLEVLSHANNTEIGSGTTEIRGRTAPYATVDIQARGIASLAGLIGLTQQIFSQSVTADVNGNFAFSFQPQYAVPGARYEIDLHAVKADLSKDLKLILFQKK